MRKSLIDFFQSGAERFRAIIITGTDPAFCAGLDLKEKPSTKDAQQFIGILQLIYESKAICIAAVNGAARGGGMMLVNACDLAISSKEASFGMPTTVPVSPGPGNQEELEERTAAWMQFAGKKISPDEAIHQEFLNKVVPHDHLLGSAKEWASQIASMDIQSVHKSKGLINMAPFANAIKKRSAHLTNSFKLV